MDKAKLVKVAQWGSGPVLALVIVLLMRGCSGPSDHPLPEAFWTSLAPTIASLGGVIAAIGAMLVGINNSRKANAIMDKADEIHTLTNSNLSAVTNALEVANAKIAGLDKLISSMVINKADTARASDRAIDAAERREPKKEPGL